MSDAGGNGRSAPGPGAEATHAYGADEARAYVPPQAIKQKPKPSDDGGAKVQIRDSSTPRGPQTVEGGTMPMTPVPPEVQAHVRASQEASALAQHQTPAHGVPVAAQGALPFRAAAEAPPAPAPLHPPVVPPLAAPQAPPSPPPVMPGYPSPATASPATASPATASPAATAARPKRPPAQLTSAGSLSGVHGAPLTIREALGLVAPPHGDGHAPPNAALRAPAVAAPLAAAPPPAGGHAGYPPAPDGSASPGPAPLAPAPLAPAPPAPAPPAPDQLAVSAIAPGGAERGGPPDASPQPIAPPTANAPGGEHPLASTNSPWSQEQKLSADVLPSASVLAPQEIEPAAPPPVEAASSPGSRTAMTIGLAVAAIALVAAVVYFTVTESNKSDDPANVKVGTEQREYGDEPQPAPTVTATAAPKAAPPVPRPVLKAPPRPPPKEEDIYEGIE